MAKSSPPRATTAYFAFVAAAISKKIGLDSLGLIKRQVRLRRIEQRSRLLLEATADVAREFHVPDPARRAAVVE